MFRLQNRLDNYSSSVYGNDVYLQTRDKDIIEIEFHKNGIFKWKQQIQVESEYHSAGVWEDETRCFFGYSKKIETRKKENGDLIAAFEIDGISHFNGQYFISTKKTEGKNRDVILYKIENTAQSVNALSNLGKAKYFNILDKLFSSSKTSIESLNDIKWQQTFTDLTNAEKATLHSRVLNGDDKLFFGIDGNENRGVFVLDIETGAMLKKYDTESYEIFKDGDYIYTTKFQNTLCRINIKTLELEEWDCNALITENGFCSIHDHRCDVVNDKFYFTQTIGDDKAKLGVLDWEKKKLVYKHEFEPKNGGVGSIQVNETKIFVHTQDNVLHIYEQE